MIRGLGRGPFGPKTPFGAGGGNGTTTTLPATDPAATEPMQATVPSPVSPPEPPPPATRPEPSREPDPAQQAFEELKQHIHARLVDQLDMNRVGEMDPRTLRNEIRGVVELLCDTENPLLNRNERQRLVSEILDETFGFGPIATLDRNCKESGPIGPQSCHLHHRQLPAEPMFMRLSNEF